MGSKNLGATNLYRTLGWNYAVPVGLFDIAKGAVPVLVFAPRVVGLAAVRARPAASPRSSGTCSACSSGSREGRASPPAAGVMLGLTPWRARVSRRWSGPCSCTLTGYVSLGSIAAAAVFPVAVFLLEHPDRPEILWIDALVAAGIIWLHRANIRRLLNGTEHRFGRRAASPP